MFKMNLSVLSTPRRSVSSGPAAVQKGVAFAPAPVSGGRGVARMGMDIANLRTSRGCHSCGK